jgi:hypothetical protein
MKNSVKTIETAKKATTKKAKVSKPKRNVDFKLDVIGANAQFKKAIKTVGGARQAVLDFSAKNVIDLHPAFAKLLNDSAKSGKQGKALYEFLKANTYHHPKTGNTCVFYLLRSVSSILKVENFEELCNVYNNPETAKVEFRKLLEIEILENNAQ